MAIILLLQRRVMLWAPQLGVPSSQAMGQRWPRKFPSLVTMAARARRAISSVPPGFPRGLGGKKMPRVTRASAFIAVSRIAAEITLGSTMELHGDKAQNISDGPDTALSGGNRFRTRLPGWLTSVRPVLITLTIIIIALLIDVVVSRGHKGAALTKGTQPDASVFISTLILLYTVFMAVYGTLLPIVIARKLGAWEKRALTLMGSAVLLNLYRIGNSLGDLYTTTMGRLTPGQIHDASYEFIYYYFPINIVAIVVALGVCLRGWGRGSRKLSADRPQMTDPSGQRKTAP